MWAIGTLQQDCMRVCALKNVKELTKEGWGSFDVSVDLNSAVSIVRWCDNRPVQCASNFARIEPCGNCAKMVWKRENV